MTKANTAGFRWLPSYYEALRELPDRERLALYDAILDFGFGNETGELPPMLKGYFLLIEPTLTNSIKYEAKQKANGQKGGRPEKSKENPDKTQNESGLSLGSESENLDIDIDVDVESDIDIESELAVEPDMERERGAERKRAPKAPTHAHGEYGWVKLTNAQYDKLLSELGEEELARCIRYIDESAQTTGNKNKWRDWNLVLRKCHGEGWGMRGQAAARHEDDTPDLSWRTKRPSWEAQL